MRILFCFYTFILISISAFASLKRSNDSIIFSDTTKLYWAADSNLLRTLSRSNPKLIEEIIAALPNTKMDCKKPNTEKSCHEVTARDFSLAFNDQQMWYDSCTWWGAQAFINYLNQLNFSGFSDWRLPRLSPSDGQNFNFQFSLDGHTDVGFNTSQPTSELGYLFYFELKNRSRSKDYPFEIFKTNQTRVPRPGPFKQMKNHTYWYDTVHNQDRSKAWSFATSNGYQSTENKEQMFVPWPVRTSE